MHHSEFLPIYHSQVVSVRGKANWSWPSQLTGGHRQFMFRKEKGLAGQKKHLADIYQHYQHLPNHQRPYLQQSFIVHSCTQQQSFWTEHRRQTKIIIFLLHVPHAPIYAAIWPRHVLGKLDPALNVTLVELATQHSLLTGRVYIPKDGFALRFGEVHSSSNWPAGLLHQSCCWSRAISFGPGASRHRGCRRAWHQPCCWQGEGVKEPR